MDDDASEPVQGDATERERDLLAQLEWHEELRRSFISTITHELKTPLTIIRANAELLGMEEELPPSVTHRLEAIERGVARMVGMVNDLTTLAKVTDLGHSPVRVTVDLAHLLHEVFLALQAVADRAGVVLEMGEVPASPCLVTGDPEQLRSALTNIVDNAVKYSDVGDRVQLGLHRADASLVVTCRDEGLGISEEDQAALFTPFFRSSNPYAVARPGTGLGLDIVKGVVERHSGRVAVESELGEGTTMRLELPALTEPTESDGPTASDAPPRTD